MGRLLLLLQLRRLVGSLALRPQNLLGTFGRKPQTVVLNHAYSTEGGNTKSVGRYPIPNKKDLPYDIVELMEEVEVKSGFLPNVFKVMSHRPAEFRAFFAYYNAIMNKESGNLSKADKELIIVATSIVNKCLYCVVAHSALHRIYSKKPTLADQEITSYERNNCHYTAEFGWCSSNKECCDVSLQQDRRDVPSKH